MDRLQAIDRLQFKDYEVADQKIYPVTTINFDSFVFNGKGLLSPVRNVPYIEFVTKAFFIHRFQESGTESLMNLDGGTNDLTCQLICFHL